MGQKNILIVEDDQDLQKLLNKTLTAEGFTCSTVFTAESAVNAISTQPTDLVILDLGLPNANGTALLEKMHAESKSKSGLPPVIVLSAHDDQDIIDHVLDKGAKRFFSKPVDTNKLVSAIKENLT